MARYDNGGPIGDFFTWGLGTMLFVGLVCGFGSCKKWQYSECIAVGHTATYCAADTAGCFKGRRK